MLLVRMAQPSDLPALVKLAHTSGGGLTTLPLDEGVLSRKLQRAEHTRTQLQHNGDGLFLSGVFIKVDAKTGKALSITREVLAEDGSHEE